MYWGLDFKLSLPDYITLRSEKLPDLFPPYAISPGSLLSFLSLSVAAYISKFPVPWTGPFTDVAQKLPEREQMRYYCGNGNP